MSKIFFILRADSHIGSGHLMRCSRLAAQFEQNDITFITPALSGMLPVIISDYNHITVGSLDDAVQIVSAHKPDLVIIDCYELDAVFEKKCIPHCRLLVVIDDLHNRTHNSHILIDGNLNCTPDDYKTLVPEGTVLLIGGKYGMTDSAFMKYRKEAAENTFTTGLICFGGADPVHATLQTVRTIAKSDFLKKMEYTIVTGAANPDYDQIFEFLSSSDLKYRLLKHSTEMPKLMGEHDFAIGACGGMSYERLCVGLPSVNVIIADNQNAIIELSKKYNIGRLLKTEDLDNVKLLEEAVGYAQLHGEEIRKNGQNLIDGKGIERIAYELRKILATQNESVRERKVTKETDR